MRRRRSFALLLAALAAAPILPAAAQTVVQLEGGGSTLVDGYGATANFWRPGADGWIGIGYLDGLRLGAFLRTSVGHDTLRLGNDVLQIRFPTDIFNSGHNLLVQGAGWTGGDARTSYALFGGASSSGLGAQTFQPTSVERPLGALIVSRRLSPVLRLTGTAVVAERQTVMPGLEWQPSPDFTAAVAGGIGSDKPYAASSAQWRHGPLGVRAAYAWNHDRFRRVAVPSPYQTENDRENAVVTYDLTPGFTIGVARQNFVQDSADSRPAVRASGNSAFAGGRLSDWRLTAGVYDSRSQGIRNLSSYFALGRELSSWLDAELFILQSRPQGQPVATTPLANLRWHVGPHLGLMQQISYRDRRATILFGASVVTGLGEFGIDYQIVHQPFQPFKPFRSALNLTARLQLGSYSTNFGTYMRPDGAMDYSASGSTFLYMGSSTGAQPIQLHTGIARYVARGTVRDEAGAPIEGAALDVGGQVVFTNAEGVFFLRDSRPRRLPVTVLLNEFLFPGHWELVHGPAEIDARPEGREVAAEFVLRRTDTMPAAPVAPPEPPPAASPDTTDAPNGETNTPIEKSDAAPEQSDVLPKPTALPPVETIDLDRDILGPHRVPARFPWGSRRISPAFRPALDSLAERLVATPELVVEIQGHADATGGRRANLALSLARADAVRSYLVHRGVPAERIHTRGFGSSRPAADNRKPAGRALNRRVELQRAGD
jgi:outer membrane protein OmpA-like peptidoglycan-associated protein